jgi:hypothetical protein
MRTFQLFVTALWPNHHAAVFLQALLFIFSFFEGQRYSRKVESLNSVTARTAGIAGGSKTGERPPEQYPVDEALRETASRKPFLRSPGVDIGRFENRFLRKAPEDAEGVMSNES